MPSEESDEKPDLQALLASAAVGITLAVLLIAIAASLSGVWPPFMSVVSGSMEPNISEGSLVYVSEPSGVDDIVTAHSAGPDSPEMFGKQGSVIVFTPHGGKFRSDTFVIHRAMLHVDEGENWYTQADSSALPDDVDSCDALANCPAPHSGFITKGDANTHYDQALSFTGPVRQQWVHAEAVALIPHVGWLRILMPFVILAISLILGGQAIRDWLR